MAISGNLDKEHFILEMFPTVELAVGALHLPFPSNWPDSDLAVSGTREAVQRGLVIKECLQLSHRNGTHSCALLWTLTAKILLFSKRVEIWNNDCISVRKPGLQHRKRAKDLADNQDAPL